MNPVAFALVFLVSFIMALGGAYTVGKTHGKKEMLSEIFNKNMISAEIYVKLLNAIK